MKTRIYQPTPTNLKRLAASLRAGKLVAVPSETVYGLAGNALDPEACLAIYQAKERPQHDPLIVHVSSIEEAKQLTYWDEILNPLASAFWPGPLTLIVNKRKCIPDIATSGMDSVAIRIPNHPVFRALLTESGRPLAAPSANPFGYVSPTTAAHVMDGLSGRIPAIIDGGACSVGIESTILDARNPQKLSILRPGAITAGEISALTSAQVQSSRERSIEPIETSRAPGQLNRHYSPKTPLSLHQSLPPDLPSNEAIVHFFNAHPTTKADRNTYSLSTDGTGENAAHNLFGLLRKLDQENWKRIHVELPPVNDPWRDALTDRLSRAASR